MKRTPAAALALLLAFTLLFSPLMTAGAAAAPLGQGEPPQPPALYLKAGTFTPAAG